MEVILVAWKPELSTTLLGKATFLMVPRAGELSAILLNHLFGHELVGILWSFGSPGVVDLHVAVLSSNLAMAPSMMSSSPKCDFLSSSHPFIHLFSHPLSFTQSLLFTLPLFLLFIYPLVNSSILPLFHSCTLPLFHSSTLPFSHSPLSQYFILPLSHPLTPPFFHPSTCPAFHSSTGPLVRISSSSESQLMHICRGGKLTKEYGMKSSHRMPPLVVYNPVRQDGICCSSLE